MTTTTKVPPPPPPEAPSEKAVPKKTAPEQTVRFSRKPARLGAKGRVATPESRAEARKILDEADGSGEWKSREFLIENLHRLQDAAGFLSAAHLTALAAEMKLSMAEVYEVATFYHHFAVVKEGEAPPPRLTVRVCDSLSCEMAGANRILSALRSGIEPGAARVVRAPCVGRCAEAPVAVVGQNPISHATVDSVLAAVRAGQAKATVPAEAKNFHAARASGGYKICADLADGKLRAEDCIKTLEDSGLRGLGGAGFPAGQKWKIVRGMKGDKVVAVNIDEGEPGTFKDRFYLEREPHRFLEGALIAARAVGAADVFIYLRDEYHGCRLLLERELRTLRAEADFPLPRIHLRRGAGAYICGEESAMIESVEGKRGEPRLRPPYVAEVGVFGRPTLEHNMETLHWVPEILSRGAEWFSSAGRNGRGGWRSYSVSGRVRNPGVHWAPAGITARELIDEFCGGMADGEALYAYLPGGASGGILPASRADIPLDFGAVQEADGDCFIGSAAVIVLSRRDRARDAALNVMRFFEDESCGQCTPCRVGTAKAVRLMEAEKWDGELLEELCRAMADASICGLGQAAPNPVRCVLKSFPEEVHFSGKVW